MLDPMKPVFLIGRALLAVLLLLAVLIWLLLVPIAEPVENRLRRRRRWRTALSRRADRAVQARA